MNRTLKHLALMLLCGTAVSAMAAELPINGKFSVDKNGKPEIWRGRGTRPGVTCEAIAASNKTDHALYVETDKNSYYVDTRQFDLKGSKKMEFSIQGKGTGGFAALMLLYDRKGVYAGSKVLVQGSVPQNDFKTFQGSLELPSDLNGKNIHIGMLSLIVFANSQIAFENAALSAE